MVTISKKLIYLSVIIPAYNEESIIGKTLNSVNQHLGEKTYSYEIVVVNDGSSDRTERIVIELSDKIQNLKLINCGENRGKGKAVREGMLKANGELSSPQK